MIDFDTFDRRSMQRLSDGGAFPRAGYRAPSVRENVAALGLSFVGLGICAFAFLAVPR